MKKWDILHINWFFFRIPEPSHISHGGIVLDFVYGSGVVVQGHLSVVKVEIFVQNLAKNDISSCWVSLRDARL